MLLSRAGLIAALLAPITLLLSAAAYAMSSVYAMAAVVIGNRTAFEAIARVVPARLEEILPTLAVAALVVVVAVAGGLSRAIRWAGWCPSFPECLRRSSSRASSA